MAQSITHKRIGTNVIAYLRGQERNSMEFETEEAANEFVETYQKVSRDGLCWHGDCYEKDTPAVGYVHAEMPQPSSSSYYHLEMCAEHIAACVGAGLRECDCAVPGEWPWQTQLRKLLGIIEDAYHIKGITLFSHDAVMADFIYREGALEKVSAAVGFEVKDGDYLFDIAKRMAREAGTPQTDKELAKVDTKPYEEWEKKQDTYLSQRTTYEYNTTCGFGSGVDVSVQPISELDADAEQKLRDLLFQIGALFGDWPTMGVIKKTTKTQRVRINAQ
jgi:hypothetical protein